MTKGGYVYILTNRPGGTLYIGVTANLEKRLSEHRLGVASKFTNRYNLHRLVHYETFDQIELAIGREKQLKAWRRAWKIDLIERENSDWIDLSAAWFSAASESQPIGTKQAPRMLNGSPPASKRLEIGESSE